MKVMSDRLATMERKLGAIESLERKVGDFEKEKFDFRFTNIKVLLRNSLEVYFPST